MNEAPIRHPAAGELDAEHTLALAYAPAARRELLTALWQLDARLRRIFSSARDPAIAEIKLAWWQERLGGLRSVPVPAEPLLQRLAGSAALVPADLAGIAEAWRELLEDALPSREALAAYARKRGRGVARSSAAILEAETSEPILIATEGYALVELATIAADPASRTQRLSAARERYRNAGRFSWPRRLRPLGMVVELARREADAGQHGRPGSPARVARMIWHALTGR